MYGKNTIEINNFEVFKKGKGAGSKIIKKFLKDCVGYQVYLYPYNQNSRLFWEKHGFIAVDDGTGTIIFKCENY